jgi:hypothetical protein
VFFNRGGIQEKLDRLADKLGDQLIRGVLSSFMLCPPENITLKPTQGFFHLEKAQVKSDAFADLHLPFEIRGGLIDLVHLDISIMKGKRNLNTAVDAGQRLLIVVENAILVVGPGHHQEPPAPPWTFEVVKAKKKKLIDMISSEVEKLEKFNKKKTDNKTPDAEETRGIDATRTFHQTGSNLLRPPSGSFDRLKMRSNPAAKAIERLKKKMTKVFEEVLAHGMHVSILNIEIRYEDLLGELTGNKHQVVGGMEIGSVQIRAQGVAQESGDKADDQENFRVRENGVLEPLQVSLKKGSARTLQGVRSSPRKNCAMV